LLTSGPCKEFPNFCGPISISYALSYSAVTTTTLFFRVSRPIASVASLTERSETVESPPLCLGEEIVITVTIETRVSHISELSDYAVV
jgi:hypothetical protein